MKFSYRKLNFFSNVISVLLKNTELKYEDRKNLREAKNKIGDATLGLDTKVKNLREIYSEMKGHKSYTDDSEKAQTLLEKSQKDIDSAFKEEVEFTFKPFALQAKLTGEDLSMLIELEDIIILPIAQ